MGTNILFWNCQGIRSNRKELELYLKENVIDVIALNETFFSKITESQVMILSYGNSDFNIITGSEALAINLELSNNQNLTLATIYCPNGNPNLTLVSCHQQPI